MNENAVTSKLIKQLNSIPELYARKRHGGMFSSGDPDIQICYKGYTVLIEMKMHGGALSEIQAVQMNRWQNAKAICMLAVYNPKDKSYSVYTAIPDWLEFIRRKQLFASWITTVQQHEWPAFLARRMVEYGI